MVDFDTWQQLAGEMAALPLLFNAPLSERHAARLIDDLHLHEKCHILDLVAVGVSYFYARWR